MEIFVQFHCLSSYPDELYRKDRFPKAEFNLHLMANGKDVPAAYDYLDIRGWSLSRLPTNLRGL